MTEGDEAKLRKLIIARNNAAKEAGAKWMGLSLIPWGAYERQFKPDCDAILEDFICIERENRKSDGLSTHQFSYAKILAGAY